MDELTKDRFAQLSAEKRALLALLLARGQGEVNAPAAPPPAVRRDRAARYEPFPLTDVQEAFWVGRTAEFTLGGVATHSYFELDLRSVDVPRLAAALQRVIERHDVLRAVIRPDGNQQVLETVPPYQIDEIDLRGADADEVARKLNLIDQRLRSGYYGREAQA